MNPLISIVIPVYNVERYFPKCMESVLSQTYDNYEVILVDDGSTDGCSQLCDNYAMENNKVKTFHKANGGLASARNFGVQKAKADLVTFIDSDDFITEDYLEYLYGLLVRYDADMACAFSISFYGDGDSKYKESVPNEELLDTEKALERICYTSVGADTNLYKKEILLRNPYPEGRLYEDLATTYKLVGECKRVVFSDKVLYYWVQRPGSIMHSELTEEQYDAFWAADNQLRYILKYYPKAAVAAKTRCIRAGLSLLNILFSENREDAKTQFKRIRAYMKPYIWTVILRSKTTFVTFFYTKCYSFAVLLGYIPCKAFWIIKNRFKSMAGREMTGS